MANDFSRPNLAMQALLLQQSSKSAFQAFEINAKSRPFPPMLGKYQVTRKADRQPLGYLKQMAAGESRQGFSIGFNFES